MPPKYLLQLISDILFFTPEVWRQASDLNAFVSSKKNLLKKYDYFIPLQKFLVIEKQILSSKTE